ncbi:hypothetical protein [Paraglaciecola sp.]|uniref:hypothetical protein n=1 Tax=Paraglaciecola sp. TaxID=1920173 RepID=UPI003266A0A4
MSDDDIILDGMAKELASKNAAEKVVFLLEKIAWLHALSNSQSKQLALLEKSIQNSELFFSMPEVTLISRNKLPRVIIKAGDVVPIGDNFYQSEPYGDGGHIRWTGPERLNNFHIPIDRTKDRTLRLFVVKTIKPEILTSIKIYIDGKLVDYDVEPRGEGVELITSLPTSQRVQDTLISMFIPHLFSPSELDNTSTDNRKLGVAFHQLEVL